MKVRQSLVVKALTSGDFTALVQSVGNSVSSVLDRPAMAMLKKIVDPLQIEIFLAKEIQTLTENVNVDARLNIQKTQIPLIAGQLIELYPVESLEDFVLCFRRGAIGFYGSIFRLDAAVLNEWMRAYLEEKYALIEAEKLKSKQETDEALKINYEAYKERLAKEQSTPAPPPSNAKDNEYERFKLERQQRSKFQKLLHKTSSEFYEKLNKAGFAMQVWVADDGFEVIAESESDAQEIYKIATGEK